ncbi:hypothetical protein [Nafulsella turpanensis]|uniref:hypothetical protein n=1 Tax=Nafulsella turpanensis TaxID=1265690 RepID=UPI000344A176|nr:hypothetical protein [Nafulsella turpanensis]
MNNKYPYGILICLLLAACEPGSQQRFKRDALLEEMENREPKRLTEAQITAHAFKTGRTITNEAQNQLSSHLQRLIQEQGITPSQALQNPIIRSITDSLSKAYQADIRLLPIEMASPSDNREELEKQLLEAYQYNQENNIALEDNVQPMGQPYFLYTQPFSLPAAGLPDSDFTEDNPQAKALIGVWSILLSRRELVNAM